MIEGTMAGRVIMQGFVGFTIPIWARRLSRCYRRSWSSLASVLINDRLIDAGAIAGAVAVLSYSAAGKASAGIDLRHNSQF